MEELIELRESIKTGNYTKALQIVDELEEMSVEDKLNKIDSYMVILLLHLIKKNAQQKTTRSWELSINNSVRQINKINKRRKSGGYYAREDVLKEIMDDAFKPAFEGAAIEAFEGAYSAEELLSKIDVEQIKKTALSLLDF